jgi:hypothetical protein
MCCPCALTARSPEMSSPQKGRDCHRRGRNEQRFRARFATEEVGSERSIQFSSQVLGIPYCSTSGRFLCTSQAAGNSLGAFALGFALRHARHQVREPRDYHYEVHQDSERTDDKQNITIQRLEVHHRLPVVDGIPLLFVVAVDTLPRSSSTRGHTLRVRQQSSLWETLKQI